MHDFYDFIIFNNIEIYFKININIKNIYFNQSHNILPEEYN